MRSFVFAVACLNAVSVQAIKLQSYAQQDHVATTVPVDTTTTVTAVPVDTTAVTTVPVDTTVAAAPVAAATTQSADTVQVVMTDPVTAELTTVEVDPNSASGLQSVLVADPTNPDVPVDMTMPIIIDDDSEAKLTASLEITDADGESVKVTLPEDMTSQLLEQSNWDQDGFTDSEAEDKDDADDGEDVGEADGEENDEEDGEDGEAGEGDEVDDEEVDEDDGDEDEEAGDGDEVDDEEVDEDAEVKDDADAEDGTDDAEQDDELDGDEVVDDADESLTTDPLESAVASGDITTEDDDALASQVQETGTDPSKAQTIADGLQDVADAAKDIEAKSQEHYEKELEDALKDAIIDSSMQSTLEEVEQVQKTLAKLQSQLFELSSSMEASFVELDAELTDISAQQDTLAEVKDVQKTLTSLQAQLFDLTTTIEDPLAATV